MYYCRFCLFVLCYVIVYIMCSLCVHMCSYVIVRVFIDELQFDKSCCLTSKINRSVLEYSIIKRYTNGVYYYDY